MRLIQKTDEKNIIWRYDRLNILAGWGESKKSLNEITSIFSDLPIDFSEVKKLSISQNCLSGFYSNPTVLVRIDEKIASSDKAYLFFGLDKEKIKYLRDETNKRISFLPTDPQPDYYSPELLEYLVGCYVNVANTSKEFNYPLDSFFSATAYASFLQSFKGFNKKNARFKAVQKFKLPLEAI